MITSNIILWDTQYGKIDCNLKELMLKRKITIYQLVRITNLRYEVISKYYYNNVKRYDSIVLAKLCYSLECSLCDLLKYRSN